MIVGGHIFGIPVEENLPYVIPALPAFALWLKLKFGGYNKCKCAGECQCSKEVK